MRTLLALLLLLSPVWGFAAVQEEPDTEEEVAAEEAEEDSQLTEPEEEPEWKPAPRARAPVGLRLVSETGFGALTALGGGVVGGLAGTGLCLALGHQNQFLGCVVDIYLGIGAGLFLGVPLGIWWGGNIAGGDGGLGYTYLGGLIGTVGGLQVPPLSVLGLALPIVGGILGYEMSMSPEAPSLSLGGARLQPLLSISARGGFVGLGGSF